ncbi:hypothetical protein GN277_01990 [Lachnospiraceae bacterium WCA-9-b2]|jgi:hypothetical protein|uniref:Uncharacterized protein n=1 Tax=Sporofaciens musculi TaxID=2681861 RepID=A0A7X3MD50_9FIRM|nr:hypothetical protein [Sporofaciens musculi]MXP74234.1 hypothetical protein [Sporofaciens musculi]
MEIWFFQVFHSITAKKGGKTTVFFILSTFSTLIAVDLGEYSEERKERMFCEDMIKIGICRKKWKNGLTSE